MLVGKRARGALRLLAGVAMAALTAIAFAACGGGSSSSSGGSAASGDGGGGGNDKVKFAVAVAAPDPGQVFLFAPAQAGFYAKEHLDVTPVFNNGGQAALQQVATGKADFGLTSPDNLMNGVASGLPLKAFANVITHTIYHAGVGVLANSPLTSYSQLKGKTVGVSAFTSGSYPFAQGAIADAGMDPKTDVKFAIIGNGGPAANALRTGKVDGAVTSDTQWATIQKLGVKVRFLQPQPSISDFPADVLVTRPDFLTSHRDLAVRFARAVTEGDLAAVANPQAAVGWYAKQFPTAAKAGSPSQNLAIMKGRLADLDIRPDQNGKWGYMPVPEYQKILDFDRRYGIVKKDVDVNSLFSNELIDAINSFDPAQVRAQAGSG